MPSFSFSKSTHHSLPFLHTSVKVSAVKGVYRHSIMKSLRESDAAGVNTRQGILSISHHELCCLGSQFPPPSPLNNQDVKPH